MSEIGGLAERYVAAWNDHEPAAVQAIFAEGGTYEDPTTGGPVEGQRITEAAARLIQAFPDLTFEIGDMLQGGRSTAIEWVMRGTNTGSFADAPPTNTAVVLRGGLILHGEDDLVTSAVAYFDQRTLATQIGLQAPVMARQAGPMRFGTSVRLDKGNRAQPGALSFTRLDMGSPAGLLRLREYARPVLGGMAKMGTVVGAAIFNDGESVGYTVSGWSSPEAAQEIMGQKAHRVAMQAFFSDGLGVSAWTSVWVPARLNTLWIRCPACSTMTQAGDGAACSCGAALPEAPPYF